MREWGWGEVGADYEHSTAIFMSLSPSVGSLLKSVLDKTLGQVLDLALVEVLAHVPVGMFQQARKTTLHRMR